MELISSLAGVGSFLVTFIGLYFIYKQIKLASQTASATFIIQLENEFTKNHTEVFKNFLPEGKWNSCKKLSSKEIIEIEQCLVFFGTLQILRENSLIELEKLDKMFAFRFFTILNNRNTNSIIDSKKIYWEDLLKLKEDWEIFRKKLGKPIESNILISSSDDKIKDKAE